MDDLEQSLSNLWLGRTGNILHREPDASSTSNSGRGISSLQNSSSQVDGVQQERIEQLGQENFSVASLNSGLGAQVGGINQDNGYILNYQQNPFVRINQDIGFNFNYQQNPITLITQDIGYGFNYQQNPLATNTNREEMCVNPVNGSLWPPIYNPMNPFGEYPNLVAVGQNYFSPLLQSGVSSNGGSVVQNNRGLLYPTSLGLNPLGISGLTLREDSISEIRLADESNGGEVSDLLHNNQGGLGSGSDHEILDAKLINGDPSLLDELKGCDLVVLAKHQMVSQYLQGILRRNEPTSTKKIFDGVIGSIVDLLSNQHGNYLFQILLDSCNTRQLQEIVLRVVMKQGALIDAAKDHYGTRSVQKLIKVVKKSPLIKYVTTALAPGLLKLMMDKTGLHVMVYCVGHLDSRQNKLLYEVAIINCVQLATHSQGCIFLIKCIENITEPHRNCLLQMISSNTVHLSQDPCGNYVVQHVLQLHIPEFTWSICSRLQGYYVRLSLQKCGSNVVEKCIKCDGMILVIQELLASGKLVQIAEDPFGNYVIQKALKTTQKLSYDLYQNLVNALKPHLKELDYNVNGKNVVGLLKKGGHLIEVGLTSRRNHN